MITYFWVATLTCEDSVDPTMAIQFLDSNIWGCQSVLLRFLATLPWTLSEAVNAPRICAVFTLGSWRFGGEAKTSKTLFL